TSSTWPKRGQRPARIHPHIRGCSPRHDELGEPILKPDRDGGRAELIVAALSVEFGRAQNVSRRELKRPRHERGPCLHVPDKRDLVHTVTAAERVSVQEYIVPHPAAFRAGKQIESQRGLLFFTVQ